MANRKVKNLDDGDSGTFANGERFRLRNVRAPESNQKGGSTAKRALAGILGRNNNKVNVKTFGKDKYGRTLVDLSNMNGSINTRLRSKGYTNKGR